MKRNLNGQAGMSLVEATIILMVLAILTSVIAPSVGDYVEESRAVKAKEDVEAIGTGILRVLRDTGLPCLSTVATPTVATGCTLAGRVDILISATGNNPTVGASAVAIPDGTHATTGQLDSDSYNWVGATLVANAGGTDDDTNVPLSLTDTIDDQLVTNAVPYTTVSFTGGGGPNKSVGWRGAYLTGPVGADPWGNIYEANTIFLTTASNASGSTEGLVSGGWGRDVIVVSAGGNGSIDTPLSTSAGGSTAGSDDIIYVVQGATR